MRSVRRLRVRFSGSKPRTSRKCSTVHIHQTQRGRKRNDRCSSRGGFSMTFSKGQRLLKTPTQEREQRELPSVRRMVVNAGGAVVRNFASAAKGNPFEVSDTTFDWRMTECVGCEFYNPELVRCAHSKCGCFLRKKARLFAESCPVGKWSSGEMDQTK